MIDNLNDKSFVSAYPPYHNNPLYLTIKEIENPQQVINDFLNGWRLIEIRYVMKEWLYATRNYKEGSNEDFLTFHDEIMRLIEAVWILQKGKEKRINKGKKKGASSIS